MVDGINISLGFSNRKHKKRGFDRRRGSLFESIDVRGELCRWCLIFSEKYVLCVDGASTCILSQFFFTPTFKEDCQFFVGQIFVQLPQ